MNKPVSTLITVVAIVTCSAAGLWAGGGDKTAPSTKSATMPALPMGADVNNGTAPAATGKAVATIGPAKAAATMPSNTNVTGKVTFLQAGDHVTFIADIDGLEPNSEHGFHIHEKGDLSDPRLMSTGGHFNPTHEQHGGLSSEHHHAGDLGNLKADDKGHAHLEGMIMNVSLGGKNSIEGRSVIIHAKADDLKSQPAGDSGARIAGGEIKSVKAE